MLDYVPFLAFCNLEGSRLWLIAIDDRVRLKKLWDHREKLLGERFDGGSLRRKTGHIVAGRHPYIGFGIPICVNVVGHRCHRYRG